MKKILVFIPLILLATFQLIGNNSILLYINTNNGLCNVVQLNYMRNSLEGLGIKLVKTAYNKDLNQYLRASNLDFLLKYKVLDLSNNDLFSNPPDYSKFIITDSEVKSILYEENVCEVKGNEQIEKFRFYAKFLSENIPLPGHLQNSSYLDIKYCNRSFYLRRKYEDKVYKISMDGTLDSFEIKEDMYEDILKSAALGKKKTHTFLNNRKKIMEEESYNQFVSIDNFYCTDSFLFCAINYFLPRITGGQALMLPEVCIAKISTIDKGVEFYHLPDSCIYNESVYYISSIEEFKVIDDTIIFPMDKDLKSNARDTSFLFLAKYILNKEKTTYFPTMMEMELPELFIQRKFNYSYNGLKYASQYLAFNWIPEIYNLRSGTRINLKMEDFREEVVVPKSRSIEYYLYAINYSNNIFQTIIFKEGELSYDEFDMAGNLIYESEISLNYRDYCSYSLFVDENKFALVNCNQKRIEIFNIPK